MLLFDSCAMKSASAHFIRAIIMANTMLSFGAHTLQFSVFCCHQVMVFTPHCSMFTSMAQDVMYRETIWLALTPRNPYLDAVNTMASLRANINYRMHFINVKWTKFHSMSYTSAWHSSFWRCQCRFLIFNKRTVKFSLLFTFFLKAF